MQKNSKIHLVSQVELQQASRPELCERPRTKPRIRKPGVLDPKDIVRETLTIARECNQVLAADLPKDQLLVDLVASLALARLWKGGTR